MIRQKAGQAGKGRQAVRTGKGAAFCPGRSCRQLMAGQAGRTESPDIQAGLAGRPGLEWQGCLSR